MHIKELVSILKPTRNEHRFMLIILFYSLTEILKYYVPAPITNAITVLCGIFFIITLVKDIKCNPLTGITGVLYTVLILWSIALTFHMFFIADVRSTFTEYKGITTWLLAYFSSAYFLPNLMPFVLLTMPQRYNFDFKYLWRIMWLMCILYLCYYPFSFWNMTHYNWSFDTIGSFADEGTYGDFITNSTKGAMSLLPAVIMIYFKRYLQDKHWKFFLTAYIGCILMQAFMARRGDTAISVSYFILAWCIYFINGKSKSKSKMAITSLIVIGLCFVMFNNIADSFLSNLLNRGMEDSRSGVEDSFYKDMNSTSDWLFGRGWFGQYFDSVFMKYRNGIETGFLTLILHGGFMYLIPYVLILFFSFVNGLFRSNNIFCKSFAIICMIQIISLYPFGWPTFSFQHFVIWLGVWVCNSNTIKKMNDAEIYSKYFNRCI